MEGHVRMNRPVAMLIAVCLLITAVPLRAEEPLAKNLIPNPSFEDAQGDGPARWDPHTWQGQGEFQHSEVSRTGKRSLMIQSTAGGDLSWFVKVPVVPFSRYRLSGWIKTENVVCDDGRGVLLNVHNMQPVRTRALDGTQDWSQVEIEFETGESDGLHINCLFGGWGRATGTAWFDDLQLELIATTPADPQITIDATERGAEIEEYIYGQFIEHLGRCIYGGIWAEMLEDRKFWYPVTADYAPYKGQQATFLWWLLRRGKSLATPTR